MVININGTRYKYVKDDSRESCDGCDAKGTPDCTAIQNADIRPHHHVAMSCMGDYVWKFFDPRKRRRTTKNPAI